MGLAVGQGFRLVFLYYGILVDNALLFATMPNTISRNIRASLISALTAFLSLGMLAAPVKAQSIDTVSNWPGNFWFGAMGFPDVQTIGQTITAPTQASVLQGFGFRLNPRGVAFPLKLYVYEWDAVNRSAVGQALYTSPEQRTQAVERTETHEVTGLEVGLIPGKQYVLFGSLVGLANQPESAFWWGCKSICLYRWRFVFPLKFSRHMD